MKHLPALTIAALAFGLIAAKAPAQVSHFVASHPIQVHGVIGASMPMPDFFGSILTTR